MTANHSEKMPVSRTGTNLFRKIPLRVVLVVPFILQVTATVGLVSYLSFRNGQQAVENLADQLIDKAQDGVDQKLQTVLATPHLANQLTATAFDKNLLSIDEPDALANHFWNQVDAFNSLSFVFMGSAEGGIITLGDSTLEKTPDFRAPGDFYIYEIDEQGTTGELLDVKPDWDSRRRPWFQTSIEEKKPYWSEPYSLFAVEDVQGTSELGIAATRPVFDQDKNLLGVLGIDMTLSDLNRFLEHLNISASGQVFIMERSGKLIATSIKSPLTINKGETTERISASDSEDITTSAVTKALEERFGSLENINESQNLDLEIAEQRNFVRVTPWQDEFGLDWLIVATVPESDFMAEINANTRNTIILSLLAFVVSIIVGVLTARWVTQPILQLKDAATAVADGQFDQQLDTNRQDELGVLTTVFNRMAAQLQDAFVTLQRTNEELEIRVEERTAELKRAKAVADSANEAKSEFLANMSHELRTPLNGILGYAQILNRSEALPKQERDGVNVIYQCGSHLLTLINDVLDLSKIEARKLELMPNVTHLASLLHSVVEMCQIKAEQKGIEFIYKPSSRLPEGVTVDEKRLRQVLINLLGNAIKFTDQGSVTLAVDVIELSETQASLLFHVRDTGVGISAEDCDKLFSAFEQVGNQKKQSEGTGLGLAISQRIVKLMGGEIQVRSQLAEGSEFSFRVELPLATDWAKQQTMLESGERIIGYERDAENGTEGKAESDRYRILMVDDRWENRAVVQNLLEPIGFEILTAENGQEGLQQLQTEQPDLVITDLSMPVMDGFEFLKCIRNSEVLKQSKVIVSSASVSQMDQQMAINAGGNDFLPKPVDAVSLFQSIAQQLALRWIYEVPAKSDSSTVLTELILPPAQTLETLRETAQAADLQLLNHQLEKLVSTDQAYRPFANSIYELSNKFMVEEIEELLEQYLAYGFAAGS